MKNFVSIFSGCGGFDLGFLQAGYKCIGAFDIDKLVIDVHKKNLKTHANVKDLCEGSLPILPASNVDVLIAGPPCQGFSTVGKRRFNDPRNDLLLMAGRIVEKVKPTVFVVENVTGVTAGSHKEYWESLKRQLQTSGYQIAELRCHGIKMGVAQMRSRMIMIGWNNKKILNIDLPVEPGGMLGDVIRSVGGMCNHDIKPLELGSDIYAIASRIKPGYKLSNVRGGDLSVHTWDIPEVFGETSNIEKAVLESILRIRRQRRVRDFGDADPVPVSILEAAFGKPIRRSLNSLVNKGYLKYNDGHYDLKHTFNGKYRRLSWEKPSLTVDTRFGDPRYFLHPEEHRGFTVREAARIQGFPDDFIFYGSEKDQYKMIGNAVPPPLARIIARFIKAAILE